MHVCRFTGETVPTFNSESIKGGLGPNYYYLSKYQTQHGVRNTIIGGGYPKYPKLESSNGVDIVRIKNQKLYTVFTAPLLNLEGWREIKKIEKEIDILHVHNPYGIWIQKFRKKLKIPVIATVHGCISYMHKSNYIPFSYSPLYNIKDKYYSNPLNLFSFKMLCKNADSLICVSNSLSEEVSHYYSIDKDKIHTIYNGFSKELFYPKQNNSHNAGDVDITLIYVGMFVPRKGLDYLLDALVMLKNRGLKTRLLVVGDDNNIYGRYFRKLVDSKGISNEVKILGMINHSELRNYYYMADVFVFPTLSDSFGKAAVEAMACGLPVISTSVGGLPEVVGDAGVLVPPADPKAISDSIELLARDPNLRKSLSKKAISRSGMFSWEKSSSEHVRVYKSVIENFRRQ